MRNIFDQYKHPENKLTHALISSLSQDRKLLKSFCEKFAITKLDWSRAIILEQSVPWLEEVPEDEADRRGLPDGLIYTDDGVAIVIESKISAFLTNDQLQRHTRTLLSHGFKEVTGIAVTVNKVTAGLPPGWSNSLWSDIYKFLRKSDGIWAQTTAEFFGILEENMVSEEYLTNGSITTFSGIPFSEEDQYSYLEAKRVLRLLMAKIKSDERAVKRLNMDTTFKGRAITKQEGVWDYIPFQDMKYGPEFTNSPHMTAGIRPNHADAYITFPNNLRGEIQKKIKNSSLEQFTKCIVAAATYYADVFENKAGIRPMIKLLQRHYKSQRSKPEVDAMLAADLRTIYKSGTKIKHQPEWLLAVHHILINKQSNVQLQIGCEFEYEKCASIKNDDAQILFIDGWIGANKLMDALRTF